MSTLSTTGRREGGGGGLSEAEVEGGLCLAEKQPGEDRFLLLL